MDGFCYHYDGSFGGFLTCIRDIYRYHEPPALFLTPTDPRPSLYEDRWVETREPLAQRVYDRLIIRMGQRAARMVMEGFLTVMEQKERRLYEFIDLGLSVGPGVERRLGDDRVLAVGKALRHLQRECELLTGFVRFTDCKGVLVGQIHPKNRVLPILRIHFCDRLAGERFLLYDATHREALIHRPGQWDIVPAEDFTPPSPDQEEALFRELWRRFYDAIAIEGRYNPKLRQNHMPKRYWGDMTEFQTDAPLVISAAGIPPGKGAP